MERTQVQESLSATNGSPQSEKHTLQGEVQQPAEGKINNQVNYIY